MRSLGWLIVLMGAAGCASSGGASAPGPGGSEPEDSGGPVVLYRVTHPDSPHPLIRIPWQDAQAMGIVEPALAPPGFADALAARCDRTSMPAQCRRAAELCRQKACRIAPVQ